MTVGARIRKRRLDRCMSMKETANLIGVPTSTYRDWEYGRKVPADSLEKIAKSLGLSIEELLGDPMASPQGLIRAAALIEEALGLLRKSQKAGS